MKWKQGLLWGIVALAASGSLYLALEPATTDCGRLEVVSEEATQGDVPEYREYTYGSHEYDDYAIVAYWPSGQKRLVPFTMDMLSASDQAKFAIPGKHVLTVSYKGSATTLKIEVILYHLVTFVTNGAPAIDELAGIRDQAEIVLPVPAREGYEFLGWYREPDFSGNPLPATLIVTEDLVLYARWEELLS